MNRIATSLLLFACLLPRGTVLAASAGEDLFVSKIEPLLKARCFECHSHEKKIKGGLALDSKSGWQKGGESGPAIVPGKPEASLLVKAVSYVEKDLQMPPKKPLAADEVAALREWVKQGAEAAPMRSSPDGSSQAGRGRSSAGKTMAPRC